MSKRIGLVNLLSAFACGPSGTAGPSLTLPQISCSGNLGVAPVGMTKFRTVAHLGMGGGGWTESKSGLSSCSYLGSVVRQISGMTKFRIVAHLGMGGGGWTESKSGLSSCSYLGSAGLGSTAEFSCRAASRQVSCSEGMDRGFFCRVGCWFVDHVFVDLGVLQSGAG
jgi:hypothetical protein